MNEVTNGHAVATGHTAEESRFLVALEQHLVTLSDQ
jgi:hypothetical protein